MKFKMKSLLLISLSLSMFLLSGCGNDNSNTSPNNSNTTNTTDNSKNDKSNVTLDSTTAPSNKDYYTYLSERYDYYFNDGDLDNKYDIYADDFTFDNTYDEFITNYNGSYDDLKANLLSFKNDLETNVVKGNSEVDDVNSEIITSIDKAIIAVDDYSSTFAENTKDYAELSKDEVFKGLRTLSQAPHDARMELKDLIINAKNSLGVK